MIRFRARGGLGSSIAFPRLVDAADLYVVAPRPPLHIEIRGIGLVK
jgi:hypothetical protein